MSRSSLRPVGAVMDAAGRCCSASLPEGQSPWGEPAAVKALKNEKEMIKKAIELGVAYGEKRGVVEFEATDSQGEKVLYIYRLLVHDGVIQPLPEDQVSQKSMRHKLALWASKQTK